MVYEFKVKKGDGSELSLKTLEGKVILIVNVASQCGFTPQYKGLQALYDRFHSRGLEILAFPCNQFGAQEPGSDSEIQNFCSLNYGVQFPVMAKVEVNGPNAIPLFNFLKKEAKGILGTESIKWNFTKFLISKDGKEISRHAPNETPESLTTQIEKNL
jgi:glutathione peroxidase